MMITLICKMVVGKPTFKKWWPGGWTSRVSKSHQQSWKTSMLKTKTNSGSYLPGGAGLHKETQLNQPSVSGCELLVSGRGCTKKHQKNQYSKSAPPFFRIYILDDTLIFLVCFWSPLMSSPTFFRIYMNWGP